MNLDEEKGAVGGMDGIEEADRKLLEAFHNLHIQPEINDTEDLVRFMRKFGSLKKDPTGGHDLPTTHARTNYTYPKISSFGGESGKGEVTWECFKFDINNEYMYI